MTTPRSWCGEGLSCAVYDTHDRVLDCTIRVAEIRLDRANPPDDVNAETFNAKPDDTEDTFFMKAFRYLERERFSDGTPAWLK